MRSYCSSDSDTGDYRKKWLRDTFTSPCRAYATRNLQAPCKVANYGPVVDGFVRRYFLANPTRAITFPQQGSIIYDPTMVDIISVCQNYPGGCDEVLTQLCNGFTRSQLQSNPNAATLCGCFLDNQQYNAYQGAFGVEKICDPLCTLQSSVKPFDTATASTTCKTQKCGQSICVIDNVTISLLSGSTAGNISFGQACSNCAGNTGGCQCILSDISVTAVQSSLGNINLSQACGASTTCFKTDANGIPQTVPCASLELNAPSNASPAAKISVATIVIIIVAIIVVVIFLAVIIYLARRRDQGTGSSRVAVESNLSPPPVANYGRYDTYGGGSFQPIPRY